MDIERAARLLLCKQRRQSVLPILDSARQRRLELLLVALCAGKVRVLGGSDQAKAMSGENKQTRGVRRANKSVGTVTSYRPAALPTRNKKRRRTMRRRQSSS